MLTSTAHVVRTPRRKGSCFRPAPLCHLPWCPSPVCFSLNRARPLSLFSHVGFLPVSPDTGLCLFTEQTFWQVGWAEAPAGVVVSSWCSHNLKTQGNAQKMESAPALWSMVDWFSKAHLPWYTALQSLLSQLFQHPPYHLLLSPHRLLLLLHLGEVPLCWCS